MSRVRNDLADYSRFDRGRSRLGEALWLIVQRCFFQTSIPWPSRLKAFWLRRFGATVGQGVYIQPRVRIHFPWRLELGDHCWIGLEVLILNFAPVKIGAHACVSQRVFLCSGNHDYRDPAMRYRHAPIEIGNGAWIGAQVFVGPGVIVGEDAVAVAGSTVTKSLEPGFIHAGNPLRPVRRRWPGEN